MLLLAVRLRWITPRLDISRSFVLRVAITVFTIVLVYSVAQANAVRLHKSLHSPLRNLKFSIEPNLFLGTCSSSRAAGTLRVCCTPRPTSRWRMGDWQRLAWAALSDLTGTTAPAQYHSTLLSRARSDVWPLPCSFGYPSWSKESCCLWFRWFTSSLLSFPTGKFSHVMIKESSKYHPFNSTPCSAFPKIFFKYLFCLFFLQCCNSSRSPQHCLCYYVPTCCCNSWKADRMDCKAWLPLANSGSDLILI